MSTTTGDARAKLLLLKQAGRDRSHGRVMKEFRKDQGMTETDIALTCYGDGWNDGYEAGYQQALDSLTVALADTVRAQRSSIMSVVSL